MNQSFLSTGLALCLFFGLLLFMSAAVQADKITLEGGSTLSFTEISYNRTLPHSFYDQAMASLPRLYPEHELLAGRRLGRLGDVAYSLICYRESPSSNKVVIQAVAVHIERAWNFEAVTDTTSYPRTLLWTLERISRLPSITH